jgi:type IV pilus assembly protein PilQ
LIVGFVVILTHGGNGAPNPRATPSQRSRSAFVTPAFPGGEKIAAQTNAPPPTVHPSGSQQTAFTEGQNYYPSDGSSIYPSGGDATYGGDLQPNNIVVVFEGDKSSGSAPVGGHLGQDDQVSVDFLKEDIKSVLRYVAELYDLNIVVPDNLEGSVSLRLRSVSWESVLESILAPLGCTYVKIKNIIQIRKIEDVEKEPKVTESFLLKYSEAKKVAEELKSMIEGENGGTITFNERSNILIITDHPKRFKMLSDLIEKLDQPEKQVMIEAKFLEVSDTATKKIGLNFSKAVTFGIKGGTDDVLREYGREHTIEAGKAESNKITFKDSAKMTMSALTAKIDLPSSGDNFGRVLSNPTIVTMNNVPAEMTVGEKYPVPNYTYNEEQGRFAISGFEEKDIGIVLKVTPKIQDEFVTLKIEPKLTENVRDVKFEGGTGVSANIPVIAQKMVSSTVTIRSGYTVAIGGLISESFKKSWDKVSGLGSLPVLGHLFSSKDSTKELKNLLIFLTATQISYDGQRVYDTPFYGVKNANPYDLYKMGVKDHDLPGYRYTPQEEARFDEVQRLRSKVEQALSNKEINSEMVKAKQAAGELEVDEGMVVKASSKKRRGRR